MTNEPTVIIVDDDEAFRDSLKALLESAELSVAVYDCGQNFQNAYERGSGVCPLFTSNCPT